MYGVCNNNILLTIKIYLCRCPFINTICSIQYNIWFWVNLSKMKFIPKETIDEKKAHTVHIKLMRIVFATVAYRKYTVASIITNLPKAIAGTKQWPSPKFPVTRSVHNVAMFSFCVLAYFLKITFRLGVHESVQWNKAMLTEHNWRLHLHQPFNT